MLGLLIVAAAVGAVGCAPSSAPVDEEAVEAVDRTDTGDEVAERVDEPTTTTEPVPEVGLELSDGAGPDVGLFAADALTAEPAIEPCTLSGGSSVMCYRVTVVGYPVDHEIGPFCPRTTETPAEEAGIWFDGSGQYDLDGAFILGLPELYDDDNWLLHDEDGNVRVTDTPEAFGAAARPNVAPEYQNHCVEGRLDWLPDGEPVPQAVLLPIEPRPATAPTQSRHRLGVTLNGVMIAPPPPRSTPFSGPTRSRPSMTAGDTSIRSTATTCTASPDARGSRSTATRRSSATPSTAMPSTAPAMTRALSSPSSTGAVVTAAMNSATTITPHRRPRTWSLVAWPASTPFPDQPRPRLNRSRWGNAL